ncbi:MAG: helix-turn-helix domain-containing protein [Lachnospirales bacterium]
MDYLSHNIAANLKRIRASRGMSFDVISEQTGVSKSMLHQIEKGDANPSINVLGKIASGLRIEISELLKAPVEDTCLVNINNIIPVKEVMGQYKVWTCFPYEDNRKIEIYRIDIEPGGKYESGSHGENTKEYIAVMEGEVVIETNHNSYVIKCDDVFRFNTEYKHTYKNDGNVKTSFMCFFVAID